MALTFTEDNFSQEVLQSDKLVLVDFWATWCGPCRMISPIIDQLAIELAGSVKVGKIDVDSNNALASKYGVRTIPTMLIIKEGEVVDTISGAATKDSILQKINAHL